MTRKASLSKYKRLSMYVWHTHVDIFTHNKHKPRPHLTKQQRKVPARRTMVLICGTIFACLAMLQRNMTNKIKMGTGMRKFPTHKHVSRSKRRTAAVTKCLGCKHVNSVQHGQKCDINSYTHIHTHTPTPTPTPPPPHTHTFACYEHMMA